MRNYLVAYHSVTASKSLCVRGSRQDQAHRWRAKESGLTLRSYANNWEALIGNIVKLTQDKLINVRFVEFMPLDWLTFFMLSKAFVFSKKELLWVYHHCEGITSWQTHCLCFTKNSSSNVCSNYKIITKIAGKEFSGARLQRHCIIHHIHDTAFLCRVQRMFGWWQPQGLSAV
jgi:hypothetical protein